MFKVSSKVLYYGLNYSKFLNCSKSYNSVLIKSIHFGCRFYKDNQSMILNTSTPSSDQDILLRSIRCSKETSDVLHYIGKHHSIMNRNHILQAFKVIFTMQKSDVKTMSNGEVVRSSEFIALCSVVKSQIRSLDLYETIDILKTLSYLGVPASAKLMSILLNIISHQVNRLTLQQIIFLDFLIKDFKSTSIVDALKIALPVVFQANLNVKLDTDNVSLACDLLHYSTRKKMPVETVDRLIDVIMQHREELNLDSAMSVIRSLCDFDSTDESHRPLLHHALDIVLGKIEECSFSDLDFLLSKCVVKYSKDNYFFYHEDFVKSVCQFVVDKDCGFDEAIWTLRKLNKLGHVDTNLLDYLANKAEVFLCNTESSKFAVIYCLIRGFALANHRPSNWASLEPIIIRSSEYLFQVDKKNPWVSYLRDLCTLGTWPLSMIDKVFQPEYLEKNIYSRNNTLDHLQVLALYQEVTTLCPEVYKPLPPIDALEASMEMNGKNVTHYPLLKSLQMGLGGSSFVASGVYSKLGHFLHHVIVLRKGGYPIPLNSSNKPDTKIFLEELQCSSEHQIAAVMYLPPSFYCMNVDVLKGSMLQNLNSISALGITVIPISSTRWENLLEHERIPYLMREINEKCDFDCTETAKS